MIMKPIKMMMNFTLDYDGVCENIDHIEIDNKELDLSDVDYDEIDTYVSRLKEEVKDFKISRVRTEVMIVMYENSMFITTENYNSPDYSDFDMIEYNLDKPIPFVFEVVE